MIAPLFLGEAAGIIIAAKAGYAVAALAFASMLAAAAAVVVKSRPRHDFDDILRCCAALLVGFMLGTVSVARLDLSSKGSVARLSGKEATVEGEVAWVYEGSFGTQLVIGGLRAEGVGRVGGKVLIDCKYLEDALPQDIGPGYAVKARMKLALINGAMNPGLFDARSYWFLKGVHATGASIREFTATKQRAPLPTGLAWAFYKAFKGFTGRAFLRWDEKALMDAIVLSDKSSMEAGVADEFAEGGIAHVMSASGLHISVVVASFSWVMSRLGAGAGLKTFLTASVLPIYATAAGMRPSIIRAVLMGIISMVLPRAGIRRVGLAEVATLACAAQLASSPLSLFDKGFQMSYLAIAGLVVSAWFPRSGPGEGKIGRAASHMSNSLLVSSVITAALVPNIATFYGRMGLLSPVANLVAIPAASSALTIGLISFLANLAWPWFGSMSAQLSRPFLMILERTAGIFGSSETLSVPTGIRPGIHTVMYCLVLIIGLLSMSGTVSVRRIVKLFCGIRTYLLVAVLLFITISALLPCKQLRVRILSVGQGDCSLVTLGDRFTMLVDTGPSFSSSCAMDERILPALKFMGISGIDVLVLTHGHLDHISGLYSLRKSMRVGCTVVPAGDREAERAALEAGLSPIGLIEGSCITSDGIKVDVLNPVGGIRQGDDLNEASLVVMITYGDDSILLEADAGRGFESGYDAGSVDAIKAGHHGAATSLSTDLLERALPHIAIISVGKNGYGHPSKETVGRLVAMGAEIFRTDHDGMIELRTKGQGVTIRTQKEEWDRAPFFRYL